MNWNFPLMIPQWGRGNFHEVIEVHRGSDRLRFEAGPGWGGGGEAAVNAKYGVNPGARFYTHVSDQYGPFHSLVISATGSEAPHVLDGLLMHGTALKIAEHYTDTYATRQLRKGTDVYPASSTET